MAAKTIGRRTRRDKSERRFTREMKPPSAIKKGVGVSGINGGKGQVLRSNDQFGRVVGVLAAVGGQQCVRRIGRDDERYRFIACCLIFDPLRPRRTRRTGRSRYTCR